MKQGVAVEEEAEVEVVEAVEVEAVGVRVEVEVVEAVEGEGRSGEPVLHS